MIAEIREHEEILKEIKDILDIVQFDSDELAKLCEQLGNDDFNVELDGAEYRFIDESEIGDIFVDSIRELVEDCYITKDMPFFITDHLDWDAIVQACMSDGYGHHFSSYDGSEYEVANYYIFRTN